MHWRSPVSRLPPLCVFCCAVLLVLGCTGCNKPPVYHILAHATSPEDNEQFKIFLKGQEVGTLTGSGTVEFNAQGRKGTTLEETQPTGIEASTPWLCGWVKADAVLSLQQPTEIAAAHSQNRPVQAVLDVRYVRPVADLAKIFVDNRGGPTVTVSIGGLQEMVAAGATTAVDLPYSNDCAEAKQVRLNGQVVGPADREKTLLIDVTHSHCYLDEWASYSQSSFPDDFTRGGGKKLYRPRLAQSLDGNPDYFMMPLPSQVEVSHYEFTTSREAVNSVACSGHAQ